MPFTSLANRIETLPLVICGPIVRRAEDTGITVWLALRKPVESVELSIFNDFNGSSAELVAFDEEPTVELGAHLHVIAITAKPIPLDSKLEWGRSYVYDIAFDPKKPDGFKSLRDEGVLNDINRIIYHEHNYELPALRLPAKEVRDLHFIQGSCRNAEGKGLDAMQALDDILLNNWEAEKRPQQLYLTGDQIYADEVDDILLFLIKDAAKVLLAGSAGWEEPLPDVNKPLSDLLPGTRTDVVRNTAKFTTTSGDSHLIGLGEYFAMYLLVWSETLWPELEEPDPRFTPPSHRELYPQLDIYQKPEEQLTEEEKERKAVLEREYKEVKMRNFLEFRTAIRKVRRGLANISTLMTFDDHEATDDWHLNRDWVEEVYQQPLGRRILMNALVAYGVFQAWGNTPELFARFDSEFEDTKGRPFLEAASNWIKAQCISGHAAEKALAKMTSIPYTQQEINKFIDDARGGKIPVYPEAIPWYFTFRHPKYEALFTDARTQRALPDKRFRPSEHLTDEAILEQIPLTAEEYEFTLLASPCNLLTINYFRNWVAKYALTVFPYIVGHLERHNMASNNPDLADSWVPQTKAFEHVISRLASRGPVKEGKRRSRLVVLSGDVHFSAVMRLQYWGPHPFRIYADDPVKDKQDNIPQDAPAEMVMAHLVASGFKNEVGFFHPMHFLGYEITDVLDKKEKLPFSEIYLGYQKKDNLPEAKREEILLNTRWFPDYRPSAMLQDPLLLPFHQRDANINYPAPEWVYQMDYIRGESKKTDPPPNSTPSPEESDFKKFGRFMAHHFYFSQNKTPGLEVISANSIAQFDFHWEGKGTVNQLLTKEAKLMEVVITKDFPAPPFQIIVEDEIIQVEAVEMLPPVGRFSKLKRGVDGSTAKEHQVDAEVVIRKTVNQTHWVVDAGAKDINGLRAQQARPLTRFTVPMEFADPKYKEPNLSPTQA